MRLLVLLCLSLAPCACMERRVFVQTVPDGAAVRINGDAVGRAPVVWRFDHYGTILVEAELEGHAPVQETMRLRAPWYQWPVLAFFADVLVPWTIHDDREVRLRLEPVPPAGETEQQRERRVRREMDALEGDAARLRAEAEGR